MQLTQISKNNIIHSFDSDWITRIKPLKNSQYAQTVSMLHLNSTLQQQNVTQFVA